MTEKKSNHQANIVRIENVRPHTNAEKLELTDIGGYQVVVGKGNFKVGLNFLFFTVHPMQPGTTLMSSFLFNTALIMLCSISIIQFCASAFDEYANETSVDEIFGNQITNLRGLGVVFQYNVFVFCLFAFSGLTGLTLPFLNRVKPKPKKNFDETYE